MTQSVQNLSEKEKEALRFLLAGHDAKSTARELDLSFHTINDRLRHARRKLGVSSSREAALMLAATEEETPQSVVHTDFGIAAQVSDEEDGDDVARKVRNGSEPWWRRKGVLIMSAAITISALSVLLMTANGVDDASVRGAAVSGNEAAGEAGASFQEAPQTEAERAAREWLAIVDEGEAEDSRSAAGEALRRKHSETLWSLGVALRRNNWGTPLRRALVSSDAQSGNEPGAVGEFTILRFRTEFSSEPEVLETVTLMRDGDEWLVADYEGDDGGED